MKINQPGRWFWGGPAHGDYRAVEGHHCDVAIFEEYNWSHIEAITTTTPISFKVETYYAQEFRWHWDGEWRTGLIMTLPQSTKTYPYVFIEIESILDFLGSLWRGALQEVKHYLAAHILTSWGWAIRCGCEWHSTGATSTEEAQEMFDQHLTEKK